MTTRTWGNLVLESRTEYGSAAHGNRGRYSGYKVHKLSSEYIVAVVDEAAELALRHDTLGKRFLKNRLPVRFSCSPCCGCTQGQNAGQPITGKGAEDVTCETCFRPAGDLGWMVQYADEAGNWHDTQWTDDLKEERSRVKNLRKLGNKVRTIITKRPAADPRESALITDESVALDTCKQLVAQGQDFTCEAVDGGWKFTVGGGK